MEKYSANGPSVSAGKKAKAATMKMTASTTKPKVPVSVLRVPALSGTNFFWANIPAMAIGPMMGIYLESSRTIPVLIFHQRVLSPSQDWQVLKLYIVGWKQPMPCPPKSKMDATRPQSSQF